MPTLSFSPVTHTEIWTASCDLVRTLTAQAEAEKKAAARAAAAAAEAREKAEAKSRAFAAEAKKASVEKERAREEAKVRAAAREQLEREKQEALETPVHFGARRAAAPVEPHEATSHRNPRRLTQPRCADPCYSQFGVAVGNPKPPHAWDE